MTTSNDSIAAPATSADPSVQPAAAAQPAAVAPTAASAADTGTSGGGGGGGGFPNMAAVKAASPQLYNAMLQGIAQTICQQMAKDQANLKQIFDEANELENS